MRATPDVAAMVKFKHTPHVQETTVGAQTGGGHFDLTTKTIFTGDALYELRKGKWKKIETNGDKQEEAFRKAQSNYTQSCHADGTEVIDGDIADIVAEHGKSSSVLPEPVVTDHRIWISRQSGLPLKEEDRMSITFAYQGAGGDVSSVESTVKYEYDNVQAPAM